MELPPVLQILTDEISEGVLRDERLFKKALSDRGLLRDLRAQADFSVAEFAYPTAKRAPSDAMVAFHAPSSLNPFSTLGKCNDAGCRRANAEAIGTLASLYTDFLAVPDEFAQVFAGSNSLSASDRRGLQLNLALFNHLRPLIAEGVIRFAPPPGWNCVACADKAHPEMARIVERFWEFFLEEGTISVHTGPGRPHVEFQTALFDDSIMVQELDKADAKLLGKLRLEGTDAIERVYFPEFKDFVTGAFAVEVQNALENASIAGERRLAGATTIPIDALTIQAADTRVIKPTDLERWRALRSLDVPWTRDLKPEQLIRLRDKASKALPVFRESIALKVASAGPGAGDSDEQLEPIVRELRLQAEEVWQELGGLDLGGARVLEGLVGASTIALTVTAVGTMNTAAAGFAAGLLSLLPNFHKATKDAESEHSRLVSKPAFVLVAAKEILRHES